MNQKQPKHFFIGIAIFFFLYAVISSYWAQTSEPGHPAFGPWLVLSQVLVLVGLLAVWTGRFIGRLETRIDALEAKLGEGETAEIPTTSSAEI